MKKRFFSLIPIVLLVLAAASLVRAHLYEVPILMYHHVQVPEGESSVHVRPETFEKQMEFLKVHRYQVLSLEDLVSRLKEGKPLPPRAVAITFDDGNADNLREAFPVLRKMGFPATIFMITSNIGQPGWLSEEDLRTLNEAGIAIGSHTVNHAFLPELLPENVPAELSSSKARLEEILGHEVRLFSYPAGGLTPEIRSQVEKAGYTGAVTTNYGRQRHDPFGLHRIKIGESSGNLFNFWLKLTGYYHLGKKRIERGE